MQRVVLGSILTGVLLLGPLAAQSPTVPPADVLEEVLRSNAAMLQILEKYRGKFGAHAEKIGELIHGQEKIARALLLLEKKIAVSSASNADPGLDKAFLEKARATRLRVEALLNKLK